MATRFAQNLSRRKGQKSKSQGPTSQFPRPTSEPDWGPTSSWTSSFLHIYIYITLFVQGHTKSEYVNKFEIICSSSNRVFFYFTKRPNPIFYFFVFPAVRRKHTEYQYQTRRELNIKTTSRELKHYLLIEVQALRHAEWIEFLDAIASPSTYPMSVGQWVIDSFRLEIAISFPSFGSLFFNERKSKI